MKNRAMLGIASSVLLASALLLATGCRNSGQADQAASSTSDAGRFRASPAIPAGTMIDVVLASSLSSETANVGDRWHGTVSDASGRQVGDLVPRGSPVSGEVVAVRAAERGSRAMLELALTSIQVDGRNRPIHARAGAVIAGSTRKRNLGAIAGGVLAGALIGKNVGDGKNAAAGGLIGGAAATGVVASSRGFQVELARGTLMSFTTGQPVASR